MEPTEKPFILPEVIIASCDTCEIYDASNGNEIASYKDNNTYKPKTLSLIGEDYLIGAYAKKPMLKVWTMSKTKKQEVGNFVVPGIVSTLAVSNCGKYCIAGIKEQIYIWKVTTGEVVNILYHHYQPVTCLKFTADDSRFLSGSKDGHVIVWVLSRVIDVSHRHDTIKPHFVWTHHSNQVTDIYCGNLISRVATTSLDLTCKVYELDSGILLSTICMDFPLTCVVMGPLEDLIFLGDDQGYLHVIHTYERFPVEIRRGDVNNKEALKLHDSKIISLSVTFDGTRLMTASAESIKVLDLQTMASMMTIRVEGNLTNAFLALKPTALSQEIVVPQFCVRTFQKEILPLGAKKYTEALISRKKLSVMYDGCPDKYYSDSFYSIGTKVKAEEMDAAAVEETFETAINAESLSHVNQINHKLFAYTCTNVLNNLFGGPSSPS